ncbi:serine hydrolase [Janthinobacterium sp. SUN118]|uniref:serine hydrolase domain-containing protein n=1 Tax=Janthinobacterium sp. SUN118 TaxID=3004100 RepID=UPI0025B19E8B|nr:serine hydrolase domain-containing protein [Janthinobacterium sp. SUN118]MDN2709208.1 serine hydrolase [Janthinobacterium sp. SUN118]
MPVHIPKPVSPISRRAFLGAGLSALLLPAVATGERLAPPASDLESFIRNEMRTANIPGLAAGFARDGVVQFAQGYGMASIAQRRAVTADTMFHLASVTKVVTATMIMRLAERGKLALDESIAGHLDFPVINPRFRDTAITFRQLLTHTSSISDARYYEIDFRQQGRDAEQVLSDFLKQYLTPEGVNYSAAQCFSATPPASTWDYSNVGFALLGHLAGRIGGMDMREQTRRDIFAPLAMNDTSWTIKGTPPLRSAEPYDLVDGALVAVKPVGFPDWPVGMLRSSISDFMKFVAAAANAGHSAGVNVLGASAMAQMLDMQTPVGLPAWLSGQGLGWMASPLGGQAMPNHWGGDPGVFTAVYVNPLTRSGVAVFTNASTSAESRDAVKNIANRLFQLAT